MLSNQFTVDHVGLNPQLHTLRNFTEGELEDHGNFQLKGVRTYYFLAFHKRGLPVLDFKKMPYEDMAWVPKAKMNQYLTPSRYEAFIDSLETR